jgi:iron complex transport system permease protein
MVMSGIALMYMFNAVSAIFKIMADPKDLAALYAWQLGSISSCSWGDIGIVFAAMVPCILALQVYTSKINLLASGDDYAKSMGVNVASLRNVCLLIVTVMTAILVSFTGLIGFVGLVAPHICRIFIGSDNRYLLPASVFFGALIVVLSDTVGKIAFQPYELQVGIITAFLGAPLFLYLVMKTRRASW